MLAEPDFHTRAFVEWEEYPRQCLIAAQRAGYFAPAPIWDDITTFDGRPFRGAFDTILAGYPCQPFSHAGQRRGADDERHLWPEVARVIREVEPEWVFLENVAGHVTLGAETVLRELWDMGYTPAAGTFSAAETGAPHERLRWFCVAYRRHAGPSRAGGWAQHGSAIRQSGDDGRGEVAHRQSEREREPDASQCAVARQDARSGSRRGGGRHDGVMGNANPHADARGLDGGPDRGSPHQGEGEGRAEPGVRRGWAAAASAGGTMAYAGRPGQQGREQPGPSDQRNGTAAHGSASECRRPRLAPPGPGDSAAWAAVLRSAPHLAPAASARDLHAWARRLEADGREWWQAEAEPAFCRMVDGLSHRSQPLRLLGNAVHPLTAGLAWRSLAAAHGLQPIDLGGTER